MSVHLRLRRDCLLRERAVEMFERGFGYRLTARRLGVSAETVREWQKMYRVIGRGTQPPEKHDQHQPQRTPSPRSVATTTRT